MLGQYQKVIAVIEMIMVFAIFINTCDIGANLVLPTVVN